MKKKIYVSSCGTGNGFSTVKALKENFKDLHIIGGDTNPQHLNPSSIYCDEYVISLPVEDQHYEDFLKKTFIEKKPFLYLGFIEEDLVKAQSICKKCNVNFGAPKNPKIFLDKFEYMQILAANGVQVPIHNTGLIAPVSSGKIIIKPKKGFGSRGLKITEDYTSEIPPGHFAMEFIEGNEYTVDCFFDSKKDFFNSLTRQRIEIKSGVCTKAKIFKNEKLESISYKIAKLLELEGSFCIQYIGKNEDFYVIDINPRPGAGTSMCQKLGQDFFSANIAYHLGIDYKHYFNDSFNINSKENYVLRVYEDISI